MWIQEVIVHLRAIADIMEMEYEKMHDFEESLKPDNNKEPKRNPNLAANWNVAKRYGVSSDILQMIAEKAGIEFVTNTDGCGKLRKYYRHEDIPKIDELMRKHLNYTGKPYRSR